MRLLSTPWYIHVLPSCIANYRSVAVRKHIYIITFSLVDYVSTWTEITWSGHIILLLTVWLSCFLAVLLLDYSAFWLSCLLSVLLFYLSCGQTVFLSYCLVFFYFAFWLPCFLSCFLTVLFSDSLAFWLLAFWLYCFLTLLSSERLDFWLLPSSDSGLSWSLVFRPTCFLTVLSYDCLVSSLSCPLLVFVFCLAFWLSSFLTIFYLSDQKLLFTNIRYRFISCEFSMKLSLKLFQSL